MTRRICVVFCIILLCSLAMGTVAEEIKPKDPIFGVDPVETVEPRQRRVNILLLGIDYGFGSYWGSGNKKELAKCHTDAIMVVSINRITKKISLISIPRDTIVCVPNVYGVYKLNLAFNCADTVEEGLQRVSDAVSMLLGGIAMDYYCAVDMGTMVRLCDYIGGVDYDLEMSYTGSSERNYVAGMQHMDGIAIIDYLRARKNATGVGTDAGRTERHRKMIKALYYKCLENVGALKSLWNYAVSDENNLMTNMKLGTAVNLLNIVRNNADEIDSYVLDAKYKTALQGHNFSFTKKKERIKLLETVYDLTLDPIDYFTDQHVTWLDNKGFTGSKYLHMVQAFLNDSKAIALPTQEQSAAIDEIEQVYIEACEAFDEASENMSSRANNTLQNYKNTLRALCEGYAELLGRTEPFDWYLSHEWWKDGYVNQYPNIDWH